MKKQGILEPQLETVNSYFIACGKNLTRHSSSSILLTGNSILAKQNLDLEETKSIPIKKLEIAAALENAIINLPTKCGNELCNKLFCEEQLMAVWSRNLNEYTVKCPICDKDFVPNLEVTFGKNNEIPAQYYFLFPPLFLKEVNNLIEFRGMSILYSHEFYEKHKLLFWNMVFYFRLIGQPHFMLSAGYLGDPGIMLREKYGKFKEIFLKDEATKSYKSDTELIKSQEKEIIKIFAPLFYEYRKEREIIRNRVNYENSAPTVSTSKSEPLAPIASLKLEYMETGISPTNNIFDKIPSHIIPIKSMYIFSIIP